MSSGNDQGPRATPQQQAESRPGAMSGGTPLDETVQIEIGVRLKAYYDTITRETVPDRFLELLGELDGVEAPAGSKPHREED